MYVVMTAPFALPWVEEATGVSWTSIAAVMATHGAWILFSYFAVLPRIRSSRRAFDTLVIGNLIVEIGCASAIPVVADSPATVLWGAMILYATMMGTNADLEPSIPIIVMMIVGPLATIPLFVGGHGAWAIAGPILAALFAAAGYHLAATFAAQTLVFKRAAVAAQRQANDVRLARDLHDVVGSTLGSVKIYADLMAPATPIGNVAQSGLDDLRAVLDGLSPPREGGLAATIGALLARLVPPTIEKRISGTWPAELPSNVRVATARVTQEAIYNALRHGTPSRIDIEGAWQDGALVVRIRDNGRGFDVEAAGQSGRGITTMRSRIEELGGRFSITSSRSGSCIEMEMRIEERQAA
jgi:signal transduction histidine kinase